MASGCHIEPHKYRILPLTYKVLLDGAVKELYQLEPRCRVSGTTIAECLYSLHLKCCCQTSEPPHSPEAQENCTDSWDCQWHLVATKATTVRRSPLLKVLSWVSGFCPLSTCNWNPSIVIERNYNIYYIFPCYSECVNCSWVFVQNNHLKKWVLLILPPFRDEVPEAQGDWLTSLRSSVVRLGRKLFLVLVDWVS